MATHDSGSEENPDNFNFENLIIAGNDTKPVGRGKIKRKCKYKS